MKTQIDPTKYTAHLHPGKFETESSGATEYFHEQMLNGDGETIFADQVCNEELDYEPIDSATIFTVQADEPEAFDLPHGATFMIREDSQGFVYGSVHANREEAEAKFRAWLGL